MRSRDIVGKRVVSIRQRRVKSEYGWVTVLDGIELDNGTLIYFHVTPDIDEYHVSGEAMTAKQRGARPPAKPAPAKREPEPRKAPIPPLNLLTVEQQDALFGYAEWCKERGKDWKAELGLDWLSAGSTWDGPYHLLHQIRNKLGPDWLHQVHTRDLRERGAKV